MLILEKTGAWFLFSENRKPKTENLSGVNVNAQKS